MRPCGKCSMLDRLLERSDCFLYLRYVTTMDFIQVAVGDKHVTSHSVATVLLRIATLLRQILADTVCPQGHWYSPIQIPWM